MKLCVFGNKTTTRELIHELFKSGIQISCLVTLSTEVVNSVKIAGRDVSLLELATSLEIHVFNPDGYSLKSQNDINFFKTQNFDLGLCTGWQRLIPKEILDCFKIGVFGWHGSGFEFPNGRGRSPLNWSLRLGLKNIFHNCFRYSPGVDDGWIYETVVIEIDKEDYISDLQRKAMGHIIKSSLGLINDIKNQSLILNPQPPHPHITLPSLDENSGEIFPKIMGLRQSINIVRASSRPFPGAFIRANSCIFRIWSVKVLSEIPSSPEMIGCEVIDDRLIITLKDGQIISSDFEEEKFI